MTSPLRIVRSLLGLVVLLAITGCQQSVGREALPGTPANTGTPTVAPPLRPITNVRQTMEWILDPAADVIWDSAGTIITVEGPTELAPTSADAWHHVRDSAAIIAETGNLLMMPGRALGPAWIQYSQQLTAAGELAIAAAEAQDSEALFDAGGELYRACLACHERYMQPSEDARQTR
jgi:hypothetical protein